MHPRFFFLIGKDVNRPIGGVMQIYRLANTLAILGYETTIIQGSDDFGLIFAHFDAFRYKSYSFHYFLTFLFLDFIPIFTFPSKKSMDLHLWREP